MSGRSIRVRLTGWYLAVLVPSMLVLSVATVWLVRRSVVEAADASLAERVEAVRRFIYSTERALPATELQDELSEYVQLSAGEAHLEVTAASGRVLCRPALAGWDDLDRDHALTAGEQVIVAARTMQGEPFRVAGVTVRGQDDRYRVLVAVPMARADDALDRFQWVLAVLVPAVLLVAGAGGYWIAGRALAPVDRMTRAAQAITPQHLDRRIDVPAADDELQRLALTFNSLLARLQAAVADMSRLTNEASHELRTPVAFVRATAEIALDRERPVAEYRQALSDVLEESKRMSLLVDDMLTLARADAGVEPAETKRVDLRAVLADAAHGIQPAMAQRGVRLVVESGDAPVEVKGSPESLRRLVVILLENALKYSRAEPSGVVRAHTARESGDGGTAVIEVIDRGIGLDPADQPHLFDRFYRGARAREHAASGSGLGLSIARTIVLRHGGTIEITDGPDGIGCRARVTLPAVS